MVNRHYPKTYIRYLILIVLFLIAGLCQYFDQYVSGPMEFILSNIDDSIFFIILFTWYISIKEKIIDKKTRIFLSIVAVLLILFMTTRYIKYKMYDNYPILIRILWYIYYIPQNLIPPIMLLCAMQIDRKDKKDISNYWHLLFIPAGLFILLFLTNDWHQLCFSFQPNFVDYETNYRRGIIFYLSVGYGVILSFIATFLLFYKCRVSAVKKKIWFPMTVLLILITLTFLAVIFNFKSYKYPELLCACVILVIESLILIGFIPSNYNYRRYFDLSNIEALISDASYQIFAYSNSSKRIMDQFDVIKENKIYWINDCRYQKKSIHGGYVFWVENLSKIIELNSKIEDIMMQLVGENDLLLAQNLLHEEKTRVEERQKLYQLMEATTKNSMNKIQELVQKEDQSAYNLKLVCIYASFIKRRSNLIILREKDQNIHIDELNFSIKESLTYLSLYGVSCSFINIKKDKYYPAEILELIYDFLQECIEKSLPSLSAIMIKMKDNKNNISIRICMANAKDYILPNWQDKKVLKYHGSLEIYTKTEDDNYIQLSLEVK